MNRLTILMAVQFLVASFAQGQPYGGYLSPEMNALSTESSDINQFCEDNFYKREVTVLNKKTDVFGRETGEIERVRTERYVVSDAKYLRCISRAGVQPNANWKVRRTSWNGADQKDWENFIQTMGRSSCNTVDTCLAGSATNTLYSSMDEQAVHYSDCADFPLYLRAYFSYKKGLPFRMGLDPVAMPLTPTQLQKIQKEKEVALQPFMNDPAIYQQKVAEFEQRLKDNRYTRNGNRLTGSLKIPSTNGESKSFFDVVDMIHNRWSSASYRMLDQKVTLDEITQEWQKYADALRDAPPVSQDQPVDYAAAREKSLARVTEIKNLRYRETDFYSPAIDRQSIRVGTVLYKATGHVAIVYEITANGDILFMDAHPDNSVTRGRYDVKEYSQANSYFGAGFKNFRPLDLRDSQTLPLRVNSDTSGRHYYGGSLTVLSNEEIPNVSNVQYFGNVDPSNRLVSKAQFVFSGGRYQRQIVNFNDFVKLNVTGGNFRLDPIQDFKLRMNDLCADVKERNQSVIKAVDAGLHQMDHPDTLPANIFGADGDWESYSTPGRDLRLRKRVLDIVNTQKEYITRYQAGDPMIGYSGSNLKVDLLKAFADLDASCKITYRNSAGQVINMQLGAVLKRLSRIAFDPYLCPERRWGASAAIELQSCNDSAEKQEWYRLTQFLRNSTERDPNAVMGWSLEELRGMDASGKVDNRDYSSQFDLKTLLQAL